MIINSIFMKSPEMRLKSNQMPKRIFIYGWDGADPDYISEFLDKGLLPNLKNLYDNYFSGILHSVNPPISPAAWSSFLTGLNPGKHSIFDWNRFNRKTGEYTLNNFSNIHGLTMPEILEKYEKTTCLIGLPLMHPVQKINGFWMPGFYTPSEIPDRDKFYPMDIVDELERADIKIQMQRPSIQLRQTDFDKYIDGYIEVDRQQARAACYCYSKHNVDFTFIRNGSVDLINHEADDFAFLEKVYIEADKDLGEILNSLDSETLFILMSDHGNMRIEKAFYINELLYQNGFIYFPIKISDKLNKRNRELIEKNYGQTAALLWNLIPRGAKGLLKRLRFHDDNIDFQNSRAYNPVRLGQIYILGDDLENTRDEVVKVLMECEIINSNSIYLDEDIYNGPFKDEGPDILFTLNDPHTYIMSTINGRGIYTEPLSGGGHNSRGVIYSNLEKDKVKRRDKYSIMDIFPSVLNALNIPVPSVVDGLNFLDAEESYEDFDEETYLKARNLETYNSEESEKIKERLKDLGYL
ncbi:hypothetical protein GF312_15905 [Candidatus Poribacteria bacterium]|nr:hypothetical protein [Candidatus Poribacteria bacterium]